MLKHRLLFGTLMSFAFSGLVCLDGYLDGSIDPTLPDKPIQGTILAVLVVLLAVPAQIELSTLVRRVSRAQVFRAVTLPATAILASSWYWPQFFDEPLSIHLALVMVVLMFSMFGIFLLQSLRFASENMITNCSVNCFSILYLGFMSSFYLGTRVDYGLWPFLMFTFTIKFADIGAYVIGKNWGKTRFSPTISPAKTWEGAFGGCLFAAIVAFAFATVFDIMAWWLAVLFGVVFAFLGQLGDLIESMIKRDAEQKDSSGCLPGFGGLLDLIDSPLATAPLAYLFFMLTL